MCGLALRLNFRAHAGIGGAERIILQPRPIAPNLFVEAFGACGIYGVIDLGIICDPFSVRAKPPLSTQVPGVVTPQ